MPSVAFRNESDFATGLHYGRRLIHPPSQLLGLNSGLFPIDLESKVQVVLLSLRDKPFIWSSMEEFNTWKAALLHWQRNLLKRLEGALGRELVIADLDCIAWSTTTESMTVQTLPLLRELRSRNLISNVFRSEKVGR